MICARVKKKGSKVGLIYSYINKIILYNNILPAEDGIMVYVPSETEIERSRYMCTVHIVAVKKLW